MKKTILLLTLLLLSIQFFAQDKATRPSPPAQLTTSINGKSIVIDYSQPAVNGREIWGKLVPYGQVWRAGANETTAFTTSNDIAVEGKALSAGKYAFFVIPNEKEWIIIFNKTIKWGAFSYKQDEDVLRVTVPVKKAKKFYERLTYEVSSKNEISLLWENVKVSFKIK
ncbi:MULTISPECIES: DUF2911 domain-containing protein [unclassified Arcicella]|uniref:DUF2911 domain-containing protein n=1 Tax=unclassified Arcicella TaxID=2644986 RepID=UPI00286082AC|nr:MULTISPECIES: DUF2911 domain-containing protein [unclassified Arcicella]MDR6560314.1 hypothetical protein [Arcicella sp. BE51]MDR6810080.1 hypothetical protein [Arcicella sp. BE140]MDR6821429.1 hypothetical protein [Arcicella sp. BE139]